MADHAELVERLTQTPAAARAIHPVPSCDGWPPQVVLGHLAYVERNVWLPRLHEMAETDVPVWEWWEPDGVDWYGLYGSRRYPDVADEFELARAATADHLVRLPEAGWSRRARHAVFGELAVAGLCEEILGHDHQHLAQLRGG